jgi:hypothetical protein
MACNSILRAPRRGFALLALTLSLGLGTAGARAQSYDATGLQQPTDLQARWLVHAGDSPTYAAPGFDDSQWQLFDSKTSLHKIITGSQPQVVWFRLHVKVTPGQKGLALAEHSMSSAFEVYANGERILQSGHVDPFEPYTRDSLLLVRFPDADFEAGSFVLALRVHVSPLEWSDPYPLLGDPTYLMLGQEQALWEHNWLIVIGHNGLNWALRLLCIGLGLVALALFSAQRQHKEYLWIFLMFSTNAYFLVRAIAETFHSIPAKWELLQVPVSMAGIFFSVLMYYAFLGLRFGLWIRIYTGFSAVLGSAVLVELALGSLPVSAILVALLPLLVLTAGVIPILLIVHLRRGNQEAGILLIPSILSSLALYLSFLSALLALIPPLAFLFRILNDLLFNRTIGPFTVAFSLVTGPLYTLSLAVIMVHRSTQTSRQQAMLEAELAAAREVQQLIVPEQVEKVPGFVVESAYEPAQQVGGDFFQILPTIDGGLLVIVGDVAGKGLHAAMLVSVVIGAIRGVAGYTQDPAELLANLNERLIGRTHGSFSTALAAGISADGQVTIANAGHLSPYLDGKEVDLPGALPLGIVSGAAYDSTRFSLAPGSRLTFYSDGVIEAQDAEGRLFGFERGREISMKPAAAIVEAARQFGQQDDITVVTITRNVAIASAA